MLDTIDMIAFDADDTLWHNETLFHLTHEKYSQLLAGYHSSEWIEKKLFETEMRNLQYYGYGIKGFTLSMIETAIELTESRVSATELKQILDYGREMMKAPVELLPGTFETIKTLSGQFRLILITKGDLFDQESKIARSGLSDFFQHVEILTRKNEETYGMIIKKYGVKNDRFLMVGNSLKSDILPVLEIGGYGVYIPYPLVWKHEKVEEETLELGKNFNFSRLDDIRLLPGWIKSRGNQPGEEGKK